MTLSETYPVNLWGFETDDLCNWPPDLKPVVVSDWPAHGTVVVHARALDAFCLQADTHPLADGSLPTAILYVPNSGDVRPDAWRYFDATVRAGDWDALRTQVACPELFAMVEQAQMLPAAALATLPQPLADLPASALPLPVAVCAHLATCVHCRMAFDRAVENRLRWRRTLLCPVPERLAAFAREPNDATVAQHVSACTWCATEVVVLRRTLAPAWLSVPLAHVQLFSKQTTDFVADLASATTLQMTTQTETFTALLKSLLGMTRLAGALTWRQPAAANRSASNLAALLSSLQEGQEVVLERPHRDLVLRQAADGETLCFGPLHGDHRMPITEFRVELCHDDRLLWGGDSQAGRVCLPLAALTEAMEAGANQLLIRAHEPIAPLT